METKIQTISKTGFGSDATSIVPLNIEDKPKEPIQISTNTVDSIDDTQRVPLPVYHSKIIETETKPEPKKKFDYAKWLPIILISAGVLISVITLIKKPK